jgi:hypothetical protein
MELVRSLHSTWPSGPTCELRASLALFRHFQSALLDHASSLAQRSTYVRATRANRAANIVDSRDTNKRTKCRNGEGARSSRLLSFANAQRHPTVLEAFGTCVLESNNLEKGLDLSLSERKPFRDDSSESMCLSLQRNHMVSSAAQRHVDTIIFALSHYCLRLFVLSAADLESCILD